MQNENHEDEIDLLQYWNVLWRRKWMIIVLCLVSVIGAAITSMQLPEYFKSEAIIISSSSEMGGLGAALSSIPLAGALAGAAGIQTPADKIMVILKSRTMAEAVIKRFNLIRIFHEKKWDPVKNTWKNPEDPPTMMETVKMLSKKVSKISKSKEGAITITTEWKNPELAADIANYYISVLSGFLNEKSINVNIQVVDRAVPAEKKSKPMIIVNMAVAGLVSLFIGLFIAFFQEFLQKQKSLSRAVENDAVMLDKPSFAGR